LADRRPEIEEMMAINATATLATTTGKDLIVIPYPIHKSAASA
jgi:hypothetical protein